MRFALITLGKREQGLLKGTSVEFLERSYDQKMCCKTHDEKFIQMALPYYNVSGSWDKDLEIFI